MDFEDAAQRLARDQQKLRGRSKVVVSAKAKREADYRKKQQERIRLERQRKQRQEEYAKKYYVASERALQVKSLGSGGASLELIPTSIWGEGDKIALPPSVLGVLMSSATNNDHESNGGGAGSPWMFRIGIPRGDYKFPSSPVLQTLKPPSNDDDHDDSDDDDENMPETTREAYLDELNHKYCSYTHGTVVEFTQEEGHVGLPEPIAKALLLQQQQQADNTKIPTRRTKDPSSTSTSDNSDDDGMQVDGNKNDDDEDMEKTPGHVAYGAFDIPDLSVEISLLKLPKGKACTLTPTPEAIENGFYNLRDIKLVLEQSLVRTRATLSQGDVIPTWHRGIQYNLVVSKVVPSTYQAITCINTDIEVEFGEAPGQQQQQSQKPQSSKMEEDHEKGGRTLSPTPSFSATGGGRTLASSSSSSPPTPPPPTATTSQNNSSSKELLPEPPMDQKENVCTIQIRAPAGGGGGGGGRRRFDIQKATITDLFQFASSTMSADQQATNYRLVTRFPRKVYENNNSLTLAQAGMQPGQELLMVEKT